MASDARKILLVEDEKAIRDAVAAYLEREGYWVVGVGDGQSAVEEFEKHQFDHRCHEFKFAPAQHFVSDVEAIEAFGRLADDLRLVDDGVLAHIELLPG